MSWVAVVGYNIHLIGRVFLALRVGERKDGEGAAGRVMGGVLGTRG